MLSAVLCPPAFGIAALLTGLGLAVSAETGRHERTLRGRVEQMGAGRIQSFVTLDQSGAPTAIGVTR